MRIAEFQHCSKDGGNFIQLDNETWKHGELVLVVPEQEFKNLIEKAVNTLTPLVVNGMLSNLRENKALEDIYTEFCNTLNDLKGA